MFVPGRPWLPAEGDPFAAGLGGTEQAVIHLTTALAERGHSITIAGGCPTPRALAGVQWHPPGAIPQADITVAINDAALLPPTTSLPVVWFHNEVEFLREWRKGRMPALRHHRPAAIFIGQEQARLAPRILPFRARATIPYGLPPRVLAAPPAATIPDPIALFTSQAYRGLRDVFRMWPNVAPHIPGAHLTAYIAAQDVPGYAGLATHQPSISVRARIGNDRVLDALRGARALLAPGHKSETFCLAAAEAIAMGVPVITRGIGSLKERVTNGQTGFICEGWREMATRTAQVLTDDALWSRLHHACLATRQGNTWANAAEHWENFVHAHRAAA